MDCEDRISEIVHHAQSALMASVYMMLGSVRVNRSAFLMTIYNSTEAVALLDSVWRPPERFDEFRIVRLLGAGATGEVYLAHDLMLERLVAVKFVCVAMNSAARAWVLDEARAIARLQHPNVVAIYR